MSGIPERCASVYQVIMIDEIVIRNRFEAMRGTLDERGRRLMAAAEARSVSIEDFAPSDWTEKVYKPDIENGSGKLYKRPGYGPMAASKH